MNNTINVLSISYSEMSLVDRVREIENKKSFVYTYKRENEKEKEKEKDPTRSHEILSMMAPLRVLRKYDEIQHDDTQNNNTKLFVSFDLVSLC